MFITAVPLCVYVYIYIYIYKVLINIIVKNIYVNVNINLNINKFIKTTTKRKLTIKFTIKTKTKTIKINKNKNKNKKQRRRRRRSRIRDFRLLKNKFSGLNFISPLTKIPIQAHKLFWAHINIPYIYITQILSMMLGIQKYSKHKPINCLGLSHKYYPL